jgi:FG-GAP repeat
MKVLPMFVVTMMSLAGLASHTGTPPSVRAANSPAEASGAGPVPRRALEELSCGRAAEIPCPAAILQDDANNTAGRGPLIQKASLTVSNPDDNTVYRVAISAGGHTALVTGGNSSKNGYVLGTVWVYTDTNGVWGQQAELTPTDGTVGDFGTSIALSANGDTALIGQPDPTGGFSYGTGAAWVFVRSGDTWTEQQKIIPADAIGGVSGFGSSVALSADGTGNGGTALISGVNADVGTGFVFSTGGWWVFTPTSSTRAKRSRLPMMAGHFSPTWRDLATQLAANHPSPRPRGKMPAWPRELHNSSRPLRQARYRSGYPTGQSLRLLPKTPEAYNQGQPKG